MNPVMIIIKKEDSVNIPHKVPIIIMIKNVMSHHDIILYGMNV